MSELLPCPFCGGEAVLHEMRYGEGGQCSVFGVFCATDAKAEYQHGHFIDNFATEADAIEAWNTRAGEGMRWHELFGTPERAARTLESMSLDSFNWCRYDAEGQLACKACPYEFDCCGCCLPDGFALLEWLGGDAE